MVLNGGGPYAGTCANRDPQHSYIWADLVQAPILKISHCLTPYSSLKGPDALKGMYYKPSESRAGPSAARTFQSAAPQSIPLGMPGMVTHSEFWWPTGTKAITRLFWLSHDDFIVTLNPPKRTSYSLEGIAGKTGKGVPMKLGVSIGTISLKEFPVVVTTSGSLFLLTHPEMYSE